MASREASETVDFITTLPSIFWSWVDEFDRVADKEKRKQLIRKVDKLRKDLYRLELNKQVLLESIPDKNPDVALIRQTIQDLEMTLEDLRRALRDSGADMRAGPGQEVEELLRNT